MKQEKVKRQGNSELKKCFKKINKIDIPIARMIRKKKKRRQKTDMNNTRTEIGDIYTKSKDIKRKIRQYCQ